ncbi:MAG: hypothetical protein PWP31_1097 [Clostridia bacterium]|nr:hypothetical protein [Clostridia bacterium]
MKNYKVDLHIHLGQAKERPVKITASRKLTLEGILSQENPTGPLGKGKYLRKGLDIVGVVDCITVGAREEIKKLISLGIIDNKYPGGGLRYGDKLTLLLGAEIETREKNGSAHWVAFFRGLEEIEIFADYLYRYIKNPYLSTQVCELKARQLAKFTLSLGGLFFPAHIFTPHKGVLGNCTAILSEIIDDDVVAVELGLSADTGMANRLTDLSKRTFLSNSDAHSLQNIGREFTIFSLNNPSFDDLSSAIKKQGVQKVTANIGLNPELGKYHRTYCHTCKRPVKTPPPTYHCPICKGTNITFGVADRLEEIADLSDTSLKLPNKVIVSEHPPYIYNIPLEFIPGVGKKIKTKLIEAFGSELSVLHEVPYNKISVVVGQKIANNILAARRGQIEIKAGGGGYYGKIDSTAKF